MLFAKLKGKLHEEGYDQVALANVLGLCPAAVSYRMSAKTEWRLSEMYRTLDLLNASQDQLHEYFPEGGRTIANATAKNIKLSCPKGCYGCFCSICERVREK
jgi:Predicted transcriptional regulator